jgi:hypothetical protein
LVRRRIVSEGIRFAAVVASDPSGVVALWKIVTGGKVAGSLSPSPVPELLHAAGLLPIALESPEDLSRLSGRIDAWVRQEDPHGFPISDVEGPRFTLPATRPANAEEALDRIEALAEWAGTVSGSPASEGALWKSLREYATRRSLLDALDQRRAREPAFVTLEERRDIVRAGIFLPPGAHSRLLASILRIDPDPADTAAEGERGDPLIVLARRLM